MRIATWPPRFSSAEMPSLAGCGRGVERAMWGRTEAGERSLKGFQHAGEPLREAVK